MGLLYIGLINLVDGSDIYCVVDRRSVNVLSIDPSYFSIDPSLLEKRKRIDEYEGDNDEVTCGSLKICCFLVLNCLYALLVFMI